MKITQETLSRLLLFYIFPFAAIIDTINGWAIANNQLSQISIGQIYRASIIIASLSAIIYCKKMYAVGFAVVSAFSIAFAINLLFQISRGLDIEIGVDFRYFVDAIYPYILLGLFAVLSQWNRYFYDFAKKMLIAWGVSVAGFILILYVLDLGLPVYVGAFGSKGFFKAQNDLGLGLLLSLSFCLSVAIKNSSLWHYSLSIFISAGAAMLMSRAVVFGVPLVWFATFAFMLISDRSKLVRLWTSLFFIVFTSMITFAGIQAYSFIQENKYLLEKFSIQSVANPREGYVDIAIQSIRDREPFEFLVGSGASQFLRLMGESLDADEGKKDIEQDHIDILGRSGLIGLLILFSLPVILTGVSVYNVVRSRRYRDYMSCFQMLIILAYSCLVGHTLLTAFVAPILAIILLFNLQTLMINFSHPQSSGAKSEKLVEINPPMEINPT